MALQVIGAGFGRTGTESLKKALEILGFGPCYHMYEVMPHPDRVALWRAAAKGDLPNWDDVFAEYNSTVDWPAAYFWRELSAHFPDAKIILSHRDAEGWYESMNKTILEVLRQSTDPESIGLALIGQKVFDGKYEDRNHVIDTYTRNVRDVQAAFGPERLLTYELGSGWEPLCAFLGCDVPGEDYPYGNTSDQFHDRVGNH